MKRTIALLTAIALCAVNSVYALYEIENKGTWPKSWPRQLEPLRKQSRTLRGSLADLTFYEIPFTRRADFESAWPHILKVKSKGAPVILVRGPDARLGTRINAGVRIQTPPRTGNRVMPEAPIDTTNVRERWLWTTFIELVVDGDVVDLNRIPLPADTPIIDERFKDRQK